MTPTIFQQQVKAKFYGQELMTDQGGKVEIISRDYEWIKEKEMDCFLGVSKGSSEPPVFLEIHYKADPNPDAIPLVFIGKGVTFDSYGILTFSAHSLMCLCVLS